MNRARHLFCLTTLWVMAPATALAYPIPPKPLWPLTAEAELIVVAEVSAVGSLPRSEDDWDSAVARLRVLEMLKGPERDSVSVPYPRSLVCPAPPRYAEGETVVAFLSRGEDGWRTVSLSYGTLYPRGEDLADLRAMVRAAVAIQGSALEPRDLDRRRREWLVQAAALPGTRWHGLYELAPASDRIRSFYDRGGRPARIRIAKHDLALLAGAFVDSPRMDHTLAMMLRVLSGYADARVDAVALGIVEGLLAGEDPPWWTRDLMWALLARLGDSDPVGRLEGTGVEPWEVTPGVLRQIWSEAKGELGIAEVAPVQIELEEYRPVGGRTPS